MFKECAHSHSIRVCGNRIESSFWWWLALTAKACRTIASIEMRAVLLFLFSVEHISIKIRSYLKMISYGYGGITRESWHDGVEMPAHFKFKMTCWKYWKYRGMSASRRWRGWKRRRRGKMQENSDGEREKPKTNGKLKSVSYTNYSPNRGGKQNDEWKWKGMILFVRKRNKFFRSFVERSLSMNNNQTQNSVLFSTEAPFIVHYR